MCGSIWRGSIVNRAWNLVQKHTLNRRSNYNIQSECLFPSDSTLTFNKPLFLFGPQVQLCQMRCLNGTILIFYSSHCILGYSNMSLSVHLPTGHDWDNSRWQGYTHTRGMHYSWRPVRPELEVAVTADRQREFGTRESHYHQPGLLNRPSILNLH